MKIERIAEMVLKGEYKNADELVKILNDKLKELVDIRYERLRQKNRRLEKELHTFRSSNKQTSKRKYLKREARKYVDKNWSQIAEMLIDMKLPQRWDYCIRILLKENVWKMIIVYGVLIFFTITWVFMLIKIIYGS